VEYLRIKSIHEAARVPNLPHYLVISGTSTILKLYLHSDLVVDIEALCLVRRRRSPMKRELGS
jgi:hypothetical protein